MTRRELIWIAVALVTTIIELGATFGSITGDPFAPVAGWGPTRPADALAFILIGLGCLPIAFFERLPLAVAATATASYVVYALRDYELGLFLAPMVVVFALAARDRHRVGAVLCAVASLGAAMVWVARRAMPIEDPGAVLLTWVAYGTVLAVFFLAPILVGEIVRVRSLLRT